MKISKFINQLEEILSTHGDIDVHTHDVNFDRVTHPGPTLEYTQVLQGRETKPRFYLKFSRNTTRRGDPVCKI